MVSTHSDVQRGSTNRQTTFQDRQRLKKLPFLWHIAKKLQRLTHYSPAEHRRSHCKQNESFHYLALQSEALVILLQETHCADAEKLALPSYRLAGSSLSRKHGLATFIHERLMCTVLYQSSPRSKTISRVNLAGDNLAASRFGGKINKNDLPSPALKQQQKSFVMSQRQLKRQL